MSYTQSTLHTLRPRLQDVYEGVVFWTDEEARLALNEALRWWNLFTAQWKARTTIVSVADQVWYTTPPALLLPLRIDCSSKPLVFNSIFDLDLGHPNWEGETTATSGVPDIPTLWGRAGFTKFAIWPADHPGNRQLVFDGIAPAPVLVHDPDFVDLGDEEIHSLLCEAVHLLAFKAGSGRFADTLPLHQAFLAHAKLKNTRLFASRAFRKLLGEGTKRDSVAGPAQAVNSSQ